MNTHEIIEQYPKTRLPLPEAQKEIYNDEYLNNRTGANFFSKISQQLEGWMHNQIAKSSRSGDVVLEVGAGTLNQVPYELKESAFQAYDVIEPYEFLYQNSLHAGKVRNFYKDIEEIKDKNKYDRIISVAVLEHLTDLPFILAKCGLLLKENGIFHHGIPSEGGLLWGLSWRLTTGISYKLRTGCSYSNVMKHEHVNNANEIIKCVQFFFNKITLKRFPLSNKHTSFYTCIKAMEPNVARCSDYLDSRIKSSKKNEC